MKKYFSVLFVGLAVAGVLSGCSDDEFGNGQDGNKPSAGNTVNFTLGGTTTRTVYDDEDEYQINWTDGDQVRIYCNEAEDVKQADYTVIKSANPDEENKGTLQYNENGLAWGSNSTHNFYAVYPADDDKVSVKNGIATFQINQNQVCTFPASADGGKYMGTPDMTNAYMVAYLSTTPVDEVPLSFSPIMTTLQITLRGRSSENAEDIAVMGVSIIADTDLSGNFDYDIAKGKITNEGGSSSTNTIFVGVSQTDEYNNTNYYIDLKSGESITFTVFLPPIDINSEHPITIRPNVAGDVELTATINGENAYFNAGSKGKLTLPVWPSETVTGNNWITPLDDDIYVQQLSIPGTHDAGASSTSLFNAGRTQALSIEEQWEHGIRAFDLRVAYYDGIINHQFYLWHGITMTDYSFRSVMDFFADALSKNPGEFVFLQLRHESEGGSWVGKNTGLWQTNMADVLNEYNNIVEWRPDLTIGDCRGKMIVLTRDDYNNRSKAGLVSDWPDNTSGTAKITDGSNSTTTDYEVQDYYSYSAANDKDGVAKISAFTGLMNKTIQFSSESYSTERTWALNHVSGYSSSFGIGGTLAYIRNAANVALPIQQAIAYLDNPGPLGIVFIDFAGARQVSGWATIGTYTVNCDLLTQTIIDNNYRYTMLRKSN